ncbi:hypothetical protein PKF05_08330 [Fusobacterium simiae]|uniref:hypothetical protein n=1 Tax=Fusobacterium TaxID=848 RepID=UPI00041C2C19|nr:MULTISPECIES: hypothetical protein [Fusobacterium]MDC7955829.1 hypothetical protein [Fusobacterium simiae]
MLKKLILMISCLFLLACSNNDYGGYTRLEKPKTEIVKNYSESQDQEKIAKKQEERNVGNSVLYDVATQVASDMLDLGIRLLFSTIVPQ